MDVSFPAWLVSTIGTAVIAQAMAAVAWGMRLQQRMALTERGLAELEVEAAVTTSALAGVRDRLAVIETDVKWIRRALEAAGGHHE